MSRVEKISYRDVEGKYYRKGARLEIDVYAHNDKIYLLEVKSLAEAGDVEWFEEKCEIFEWTCGRAVEDRRYK